MATEKKKWAEEISTEILLAATKALKKWKEKKAEENEKSEVPTLLEDEREIVNLMVSVKELEKPVAKGHRSNNRATRISLKHSIYAGENQEICLFVKDPEIKWNEKLLEKKEIGNLTEVMGITRLRNEYRGHHQKRQLCKEYDLFLADERIIPLLPTLLGKHFFQKKKHPFKINLQKDYVPERICKLRDSTFLHTSNGPLRQVKTGWTDFTSQQIVENVECILNCLPTTFDNIVNIGLKTNDSPTFPIYASYDMELDISG